MYSSVKMLHGHLPDLHVKLVRRGFEGCDEILFQMAEKKSKDGSIKMVTKETTITSLLTLLKSSELERVKATVEYSLADEARKATLEILPKRHSCNSPTLKMHHLLLRLRMRSFE